MKNVKKKLVRHGGWIEGSTYIQSIFEKERLWKIREKQH